MSKDYYDLLGIDKNSSKEEIKKAYKRLAMKYHPDRNKGDSEAEKKFKEINEAYQILGDQNKKAQYDRFGNTGGSAGFGGFGGGAGGGVDFDLSDIFEQFFGGSQQRGGRRKATNNKGEDLEYIFHLDLSTSISGGKKEIKFEKAIKCDDCNGEGGSGKETCPQCNGNGTVTYRQQSVFGVVEHTGICDKCNGTGEIIKNVCSTCHGNKRIKKEVNLDVDIPAGIDDGMIIKIEGEGNDGLKNMSSGDLYVKFRVKLEEKGLKRKGVDLYYDLEIDVIEAILGTKKEINLPILGKRTVEIEAGTQYGTIIKKVGEGVKYIDRDKKGDLFINLDIKIPKKLGKEERSLYEDIAKEKKINFCDKKGIFEKLFG